MIIEQKPSSHIKILEQHTRDTIHIDYSTIDVIRKINNENYNESNSLPIETDDTGLLDIMYNDQEYFGIVHVGLSGGVVSIPDFTLPIKVRFGYSFFRKYRDDLAIGVGIRPTTVIVESSGGLTYVPILLEARKYYKNAKERKSSYLAGGIGVAPNITITDKFTSYGTAQIGFGRRINGGQNSGVNLEAGLYTFYSKYQKNAMSIEQSYWDTNIYLELQFFF